MACCCGGCCFWCRGWWRRGWRLSSSSTSMAFCSLRPLLLRRIGDRALCRKWPLLLFLLLLGRGRCCPPVLRSRSHWAATEGELDYCCRSHPLLRAGWAVKVLLHPTAGGRFPSFRSRLRSSPPCDLLGHTFAGDGSRRRLTSAASVLLAWAAAIRGMNASGLWRWRPGAAPTA